jgi:pimeloyl-ACP methyl ester carboxylesterase
MFDPLWLTVRTSPTAGSMRAQVQEEVRPPSGAPWLIYIHGFNVTEERAREQWAVLRGLLPRGTRGVYAGPFLWPSDRYEMRFLSRLSYADILSKRADQAGRILGQYLRERAHGDVILVGHSLGARVALNAATTFQSGRPQRLRGLALLGAAVPVSEMTSTGEFWDQLAVVEAVGVSPDDRVLGSPFGIGQLMSAPFAPRTEAVGLRGWPEGRDWCRVDCKIDHHEYWRAKRSAEVVANVSQHWMDRTPASAASPLEWSV